MRQRLDDEGIASTYLDGRTRKRGEVIDEFKHGDAPVFLISLKAGGFGLNLTEADYCLRARPVVEPRRRGPGRRPRAPDRPDRSR